MLSFMRTDAGLVQSVLAGRVDRFDELMRRHFNTAYGIAFSYTHNHADAEDLCQDAFLKAYQSLDKLDEPKKFGHWLSVITRNLARTWYQRRSREGEVLLELPKPQADSARYDDMRELLTNQIQDLDPIPREVLMRHYFAGQTTGEIAKSMGVSQAAVLKRLQRAREALGTKLIHELKLIPAAEPGSAERRRKIMGAITATGLTWKLGGGGITSAAAGALANAKVIAGIAIVVGAGGLAAYTNYESPDPGGSGAAMAIPADGASETQTPQTAPANEAPIPENEVQTTDASTNNEVAAPFQLAQAADEDDAESASVAPVDSDSKVSLDGDWRLSLEWKDTATGGDYVADGIVQIKQDGSDVEIDFDRFAPYWGSLRANGKTDADSVVLEFSNDDADDGVLQNGRFTGKLSDDGNMIALTGSFSVQGKPDEAPIQIRPDKFQFERLNTDDPRTGQRTQIELAKKRLGGILAALSRFRGSNDSFPSDLSQLTTEYLSEQSLLQLEDHQSLIYTPLNHESLEAMHRVFGDRINSLTSRDNFLQTNDPGFLLDWEEDLATIYGDYFPGGYEILRFIDEKYAFVITKSDTAYAGVQASSEFYAPGTVELRAYEAEMRSNCMNNLKQLGLSFKMFENECPGEYIPAGFRHIYPEYITDPSVLTCPADNVATISYTVLYPASNREDWIAIHEAVNGPIDDDSPDMHSISLSSVPWIIEADHCADGLGRNVLFGDGHVEYLKDDEFNRRIGPYLQYAY